jgi:hypothetical protein
MELMKKHIVNDSGLRAIWMVKRTWSWLHVWETCSGNGCKSVDAVTEKLVTEQLLNTKPDNLRIWISERKPKTCREAGRLADDYLLARKNQNIREDQVAMNV